MSQDDIYHTISGVYEAEIKIKGSKFISTICAVTSLDEAENFIHELSKKYYNATHNCYAFRVRTKTQVIERLSDAGEPSGTAGPPIMDVLRGRDLYNVAVVVTRYFGGTKLGKGGLVRAYRDSTKEVIEIAKIVKKINYKKLKLSFGYDLTGLVMRTIEQFKGRVVASQYNADVEIDAELPDSSVQKFRDELVESSSGQISIEP